MENWLAIIVGVLLASAVLYGHYRGFLRLAVSMGALVISLGAVHLAMPTMTSFLRQNEVVQEIVSKNLKNAWNPDKQIEGDLQLPASQRTAIENLDLPQPLKDALIENNNNEVYKLLGANRFSEYIGNYISNVIINVAAFLFLFAAVYVLIHVVMKWVDLIARLPIIRGINQIAGALLGGIQGLLFFWIFCLCSMALSGTEIGHILMEQIQNSTWLLFLYNHNLLEDFMMGMIYSII